MSIKHWYVGTLVGRQSRIALEAEQGEWREGVNKDLSLTKDTYYIATTV